VLTNAASGKFLRRLGHRKLLLVQELQCLDG